MKHAHEPGLCQAPAGELYFIFHKQKVLKNGADLTFSNGFISALTHRESWYHKAGPGHMLLRPCAIKQDSPTDRLNPISYLYFIQFSAKPMWLAARIMWVAGRTRGLWPFQRAAADLVWCMHLWQAFAEAILYNSDRLSGRRGQGWGAQGWPGMTYADRTCLKQRADLRHSHVFRKHTKNYPLKVKPVSNGRFPILPRQISKLASAIGQLTQLSRRHLENIKLLLYPFPLAWLIRWWHFHVNLYYLK